MNSKALIGVVALVAVLMLASSTIYFVDEREKALVFKFGEVVRADSEPGPHFKLPPPFNSVKFFDARIQTMDAPPESYLTSEKKNLVVDSFVKWRIRDTKQFYVTVSGLVSNARARLAQRVNDALRQEFGKRNVQEVISGDRAEIMDLVRKATDEEAREIGVEVVDVRLKRVDLDVAISEGVYSRMEAERTRVAKELRAQGFEASESIRADADRQNEIIMANAFKTAETLRGEGDATTTAIYASAFGKDKEFYNFYRSLNAYKETFGGQEDLIVRDPSSDFFKYFKESRSTK